MAEGLSTGDLALMKDNDGFGNGNGLWIFALLLLMFGGNGGFGWGGNRGPAPASADQVAQGFNNQNMQSILLSSANNNYETAQLINAQTNALMQQNNTNLINAIQGFNAVNISLQNMQAKMDSCCCEIKTQMLQNRYVDMTGPCAIIMGSEGKGISQTMLDLADDKAAIPMSGEITSLNVSVASAVLMYEAVRQRLGK